MVPAPRYRQGSLSGTRAVHAHSPAPIRPDIPSASMAHFIVPECESAFVERVGLSEKTDVRPINRTNILGSKDNPISHVRGSDTESTGCAQDHAR